jgi:pimeloyl-ACP methyl ester carboxylesterase
VGRDFDPLARALSEDYRVICPDLPGRGLSEWADDPERYTAAATTDLLAAFCDDLGLTSLSFVGTSLGGRLGIALSAGELSERITHLVVNDSRPEAPGVDDPPDGGEGGPDGADDPEEGLDRILEYLTNPPTFDRLSGLEAYYRETYDAIAGMDDREWRRFTLTSARRTDAGAFAPAYDTRIVEPLFAEAEGLNEWPLWEDAAADLLVVRARESDVLYEHTFDGMLERRPDAESLTVPGGHPPALSEPAAVETVRAFLAE